MKINGFLVPLVDNDEGTGKVVDVAALKAQWEEKDLASQNERWNAWFKGFGENLAIKGAWFPIFEVALTRFWQNKQYMYERGISRETVVDMVFAYVTTEHPIPIAEYLSIKNLLAEFVFESTSRDHARDAMMWKDADKGPGAKPYLNPYVRSKWLSTTDD